jgi:hypothetical protein
MRNRAIPAGGPMAEDRNDTEQRKHERLWVEFPVVYKIGRHTLTGSTVNASNEGILVESYLSSKTAFKIFKILNKKPAYHLTAEYTVGEKTYRRDAVVKHFHADFSGAQPYRFTVGLWIPRIE